MKRKLNDDKINMEFIEKLNLIKNLKYLKDDNLNIDNYGEFFKLEQVL